MTLVLVLKMERKVMTYGAEGYQVGSVLGGDGRRWRWCGRYCGTLASG